MNIATTIAECFWRQVEQKANVPALCCVDDRVFGSDKWMSWSEIGQRVVTQVDQFRQLGMEAGQHVASCLPNGLRWIEIDLACQTMGLVHVALDRRLPAPMIEKLYDHSGAVHLFSDVDQTEEPSSLPEGDVKHMRMLAAAVDGDAPAQMLYTSGSIGRPKGVLLSHRNLVSNGLAKLDASPQFATDLRLNLLPFSHAYARTCELSTWVLSRSRLAIASDWAALLACAPRLQPTLVNLVPYLAAGLADALDDNPNALGKSMRLLQIGGAAVSEVLFDRLEAHGLAPVQGYGLTEASPVVCSNRAGCQQQGTVGMPVIGTELRIDNQGVLWVRGPQVMLGYWNDVDATSDALRDGWLCTGDLATQDTDGMVRILGRQSEQICLTTGYKVSPEEIEALMLTDEWLEQAVVLGNQCSCISAWVWPKFQEIPGRFFDGKQRNRTSLNTNAWTAALRQRVQARMQHLPRYMVPETICLLPEPLSPSNGTLTSKLTPRRKAIADHIAVMTS